MIGSIIHFTHSNGETKVGIIKDKIMVSNVYGPGGCSIDKYVVISNEDPYIIFPTDITKVKIACR